MHAPVSGKHYALKKNGQIMHAPTNYAQRGKCDKMPGNGGEASPKSA